MEDKLRRYGHHHQQQHQQYNHRLIVDDDNYNDSDDQQDTSDDNYHNYVHRQQTNLVSTHQNNNNNKFDTNRTTNYNDNRQQSSSNSGSYDEQTSKQQQQQNNHDNTNTTAYINKRSPPHRPSSICHSEDGQAPSTISFNSGYCYSLLDSWKQKRMRQQSSHNKAHSTLTTTSRASSTHRPESTLSSYISSKLRIAKPKRAPLGLSQHYVTDSRRRRRANELILRTIEARRRLMATSPTFSTMTDNTITTTTGGRHSYSTPSQQQPAQSSSPSTNQQHTVKYGNSNNSNSNSSNRNNININNSNQHNDDSEVSDYYTNNYMTTSIRTKSPSSPKPMASSSNHHRFRVATNNSTLNEPYSTTNNFASSQKQQQQPPSSSSLLRQNRPQQQQQQHHLLYHNEPPPLAKLDDNTSESDAVSNNGSKLSQSKLLRRHINTSNISVSSSSDSSTSTSASLSNLVTDEQKGDLPDCIMRSASSLLALQREMERSKQDLNRRARIVKQQNQANDSKNPSHVLTTTSTTTTNNNSSSPNNNNSISRQNKRHSRPALRRDSMRRMRLLNTSSPTKPLKSLLQQTINHPSTTTTYGQNMLPRGPLAELNNKEQISMMSASDPMRSYGAADSDTTKTYEARKDSGLKSNRSNADSRHNDKSHSSRSTSSALKPRDEESRTKRKIINERGMSQQQTSAIHDVSSRNSDYDSNKATTDDSRSHPDLINNENQHIFSPKPSSSTMNYYNKSTRLSNQSNSQQYDSTAVPHNIYSYESNKKTSTSTNQYHRYVDDRHRDNIVTSLTKTTSRALDNNDGRNESKYRKSSFIEDIVKNKGFKIDNQHSTDYVNVSYSNDRGANTNDSKTRSTATKQQTQEASIKKGDTKQTERHQSDTSVPSEQSKSELATQSNESSKLRTEKYIRPKNQSYNYADAPTTSNSAQSRSLFEPQTSQQNRPAIISRPNMPKDQYDQKRIGRFTNDPADVLGRMSSDRTNIVDDSTSTQTSKNKSEVSRTQIVKASSSIFNDGQEMSLNSVDDVKVLLKKMTPNSVLNVKTTTTIRSESEGSLGYPTQSQSPLSPLNIRDFAGSPGAANAREQVRRNELPDNYRTKQQQMWQDSKSDDREQEMHARGVPLLKSASALSESSIRKIQSPPKVFTVTSDHRFNDLMGNTERLLSYAKTADNGSTVVLRDEPGHRSTVERKEKSFESYILNETHSNNGSTKRDLSPGPPPTIRLPTATANIAKESDGQSTERQNERECHESRNRISRDFIEESTKLGTHHDFRKGQTILRDVDTTSSSVDEQLKKLQIIKEEIMGVGNSRNSYRRSEESKKKRSDFFSSSFSASFPDIQSEESEINSKKIESSVPSQTTSSKLYANYDREPLSGLRYMPQQSSVNTNQSLPKTTAEDKYTDNQAASSKKQTVSSSFATTPMKSMICPEVVKYQSIDTKKSTSSPLQQQSRLTYYESSLDNHDQSLPSYAHDSGLSDTSIEQHKPKTSNYRYQQKASPATTNPERIDYSIKSESSGQPFAPSYLSTKSESYSSSKYSSTESSKGFAYPSKSEERLTSSQTGNNNNNSGKLNNKLDTIQNQNNYITSNYDGDNYYKTKTRDRIEKNDDCRAPTEASSRQREQQESIRGTTPVTSQNATVNYQIRATKHQPNDEQWSAPSDHTLKHYEPQNKNPSYHVGHSYAGENSTDNKQSQKTMISASTPSLVSVVSSSSSSSTPVSSNSRLSDARSSSNFKKYGQQPLSTSAIVKLVVREKITPHVDCVQQPEIKRSSLVDKSNDQEVNDNKNLNPAAIVAKRALYATNSPSQKREQQHSPSSASESSGPQSPVYTPTSGFSNDSALASSLSSHSPSSQATTASNTSSSEDNCSVTSNENGQEATQQSQHSIPRSKSLGQTSIQAIQSDMQAKQARTLQGILRYRGSSSDDAKKHATGSCSNVPMIDSESNISDYRSDESSSTTKENDDSNLSRGQQNSGDQKLGPTQMLPKLTHQQQSQIDSANSQRRLGEQTSLKQHIQQQKHLQEQQRQEDQEDRERFNSTFHSRGVSPKLNLEIAIKQSHEDINNASRGPQLVKVSQQELQQPKRVHFNDRASIRSFESLTSASVASNEDGQRTATDKGEEHNRDEDEDNDEGDDHEDYGFLSEQASTLYKRPDEVDNSKYYQPVYTHEYTGYGGSERDKTYQRSPTYPTPMTPVSNFEDEDDEDYVMRLRAATKAFIAPTTTAPASSLSHQQNLIISPQYQYQQQHQALLSSIADQHHLPSSIQHVAVVEPLNVQSQHAAADRSSFQHVGSSQSGYDLRNSNVGELRQSQDSEEKKSKRRPIRLYTAV